MDGIKSPKIIELMSWENIGQVDEMLDRGDSPRQVHRWIVAQGFAISHPLIYQYAQLRKQAVIDNIMAEKMINSIRFPVVDKTAPSFVRRKDLALTEFEILDYIIQKGYQTFIQQPEKPVPMSTLMAAIKLRDKITDGNHEGYTRYGMDYIRTLEACKYHVLETILLTFVPEELHEKALETMDLLEDEFYRNTEFYDDYLQAKGNLLKL